MRRVRRPRRRLALAALVALGLPACGLINPPGSAGPGGGGASPGGGTGGGSFGYGKPTLELTIGGMHFGPSEPSSGSGVDLSTSRDAAGQITSSTLVVSASSSAGASCNFGFQRYGESLAPFRGAGTTYRVSAQTSAATPDGAVTPAGSESVAAQGVVLQCSGSSCDGGGLLLITLAADHVEGSFSATLAETGGQGSTEAICSFYLPTRSFNP